MEVKNPRFTNADKSLIDVDILHPVFGWIPFTANPDDAEDYGRQIYAEAVAGDFGPITDYVPPPPHINTAKENEAEAKRRLAATDWVNQPDVYDPSNTPHLTNRDAFLAYRSQVRAIAVNPVDGNLDWPTEPTAAWSA